MKILQAKSKASVLTPKEKERLAFLEERFGEAQEVTRIRLEDEADGGPKTLTSDDHWATEVSEELLEDADGFEAQKAWDKDVAVEEAKFQATDSRQGKETFQQEGLSPFAISLTDDFKEEGFQDNPVEEDEGVERRTGPGKVNYAKEENFEEAGEVAGGENPFALDLDPSLAGALGQEAERQAGIVPDLTARSFDAETDDDFEDDEPVDFTTRVDEGSSEVQALFSQGETIPGAGEDVSAGALSTHSAEDDEEAGVDYDLMRAAMDYAEEKGLVEEGSESWAVDEQGEELDVPSQDEDWEISAESELPTAMERPPQADDDLAVLVPDAPAEPVIDVGEDEPDLDAPTVVGGESEGFEDMYAEPEMTATDDRSAEMAAVMEPSGEVGIPDLGADNVPDLSGDVPDLSDGDGGDDGYKVDLWVEPEDDDLPPEPDEVSGGGGYQPPPPPDDDDGWVPEPSPMAGGGGDLEFDLSEDSMVSEPGATAAVQPSQADEMDAFWGLTDEPAALEPVPAQAPEPTIAQEPFPEPAPAQAPEPTVAEPPPDKPLPALNLQAARVQAPPPKPQVIQPKEPVRPDSHGDRADALLSSLFGEEASPQAPAQARAPAQADDVPLEPIIIGPAKQSRPANRRVQVGRGVTRQRATHANDLRGPRRATVHFRDGVNRRGMVNGVDTDADTIDLLPMPGSDAPAERLNSLALKALFLMLPKGTAYPEKTGYECKVMMIDNRTLEGYTPDYDPSRKAFTLFPLEDRGNIERIIVFNEAVKNLWFPEE